MKKLRLNDNLKTKLDTFVVFLQYRNYIVKFFFIQMNTRKTFRLVFLFFVINKK